MCENMTASPAPNKVIKAKCEQNICPVCGSMNLSYGCSDDDDYGRDFPWTCDDCGATGKERYVDAFDGHSDVHTADGEAVEICEPADEDSICCPVCGGELEFNGETITKKFGLLQKWTCKACQATGWGDFEEHFEYTFTGDHEDVRLADGSEWDGSEQQLQETSEEEVSESCPAPVNEPNEQTNEVSNMLKGPAGAQILCDYDGWLIYKRGEHTYIVDYADDSVRELTLIRSVSIGNKTEEELLSPGFDFDVSGELEDDANTYCYWTYKERQWFIPVSWEMCGVASVRARSLREAMDKVANDPSIPLPAGNYVDSSFELSYNDEAEIRSLYNQNREDCEVPV